MWWNIDSTAAYTNLLECKEGLGPKIAQLREAAKKYPSYKEKADLA